MAAPGPGEDPSLGPGERAAEGGRHFSDLPRRQPPAEDLSDDRSVPWEQTEREAAERAEEQRRVAEEAELEQLVADRRAAIERAEADERAARAEDAARAERQRLDADGGLEPEHPMEWDDPYEDSGFDAASSSAGASAVGGAPRSTEPSDDSIRSIFGRGTSLDDDDTAIGAEPSTASVRSGTITVVPKVADQVKAASTPTTSKLGWIATLFLVGLAMVLAWMLFRLVGGGGDDSAQETSTIEKEQADVELTGAPLEIFPQRALAGSTVAVASKGSGCAPNSTGVLTVRAVDDGLSDPAGRLIGQRTVLTDKAGQWKSTPMLVGEPAGTYWLTSTCARGDAADTLGAALGKGSQGDVVEMLRTSDPGLVLEATQVLELTGPVKVLAVNLTPEIALAGAPTNVLLQGDACLGSRVDGVATGPNGERITYVATVDREGRWNVTVPLPASATAGSYRFVSRCDSGAQYATRTVAFVAERVPTVRDVTGSGTVSVSAPTLQGIPIAQAATPIPADANFTG